VQNPVIATPRPRSPHVTTLQAVARSAGVSATPPANLDPRLAVTEVSGVTLDSRAIRPGDLYAALPGANVHGARFAGAAIGLGAVAVLTDPAGAALISQGEVSQGELSEGEVNVPVLVVPEPRAVLGEVSALIYGRASQELTMLGLTGTNGKTTTAYLLDSALRALGRTTGLIGTVETRIGKDRIKSGRTTPESADLHALFAVMLESGVDTCTMEVSSHALVLHRVDGVRYDVVAFMNLSQDHLDFHGSMEDYYLAKASLFTPDRAVRAVVCVDDSWGQRLALESAVPVVTISSRPGVAADWQIQSPPLKTGPDESAFELVGEGLRLSLRAALPGEFNRVNTGVAALVLLAAGHPIEAIAPALATDPQVPGRMEKVLVAGNQGADHAADQERIPLAVVDFAHTPVAVAAALEALRPATRGSLIAVLGAGGARDPGKREAMGAAAAANADMVIVTDDNPRSEDPATIRAAVLAGAIGQAEATQAEATQAETTRAETTQAETMQSPDARIREIGDRASAIREAVRGAGAGDTVVVLGKGHESGQEIAGVVHPFDDREHLRAALVQNLAPEESNAPGESIPMEPTESEIKASGEVR
jgi:UDP-N-acetylmuramoyl-L-alanyl-D-glutamate--2,6-diaminopimelate ligase